MRRLGFIILLFGLLAFPSSAYADMGPPLYPPGSNPQPGAEITQVRMVAETVVIEVLKDTKPRSLGRAHVTADFTMHNLGTQDESMAARFPFTVNNGRGKYEELVNLIIQVNGQQLEYRRVDYPDYRYASSTNETKRANAPLLPWAEFDITFPAGQDVPVRITYDLAGTGYYPTTAFYYVLETGAGWKDTIGSADIILRLPYEANLQNVIMDMGTGWANTTDGGVFQGNEVRWHFENFEPGWEQNMDFALVAPSAWEDVLAVRAKVKNYPTDSETWGMFAKVHKEIFTGVKYNRAGPGGEELWKLSLDAYEKCLSLSPNDAQWHAGFADLFIERAYWDSWIDGEWSDPSPETFRALEEIRIALELAPNDPVIREIADHIANLMPDEGMIQIEDRYEIGWLTQTPTRRPPTATYVPTLTPTTLAQTEVVSVAQSTSTSLPTAIDVPPTSTQASPTSTPQKSSPLCGSAAFLPLIAVTWLVWKRR